MIKQSLNVYNRQIMNQRKQVHEMMKKPFPDNNQD